MRRPLNDWLAEDEGNMPVIRSTLANIPEPGVPEEDWVHIRFIHDMRFCESILNGHPEFLAINDLATIWLIAIQWDAYWSSVDAVFARKSARYSNAEEERMKVLLRRRIFKDLGLRVVQ